MKNPNTSYLQIDPNKYELFRNRFDEILLALPIADKEEFNDFYFGYNTLEEIPENIKMDFYPMRLNLKNKTYTLSNSKKAIPLNRIAPLFIHNISVLNK